MIFITGFAPCALLDLNSKLGSAQREKDCCLPVAGLKSEFYVLFLQGPGSGTDSPSLENANNTERELCAAVVHKEDEVFSEHEVCIKILVLVCAGEV